MTAASRPEPDASPAPRGAASWAHLFDDPPEIACEIEQIEGTLPADLIGTLYRNGPAHRAYARSFFDGDGMIRALRLRADGSASYQSKLIETRKLVRERRLGRPVVRTAGTNLPGGILRNAFRRPGHEANTHVMPLAGRLLALEESGHPYVIDPETLDTGEMLSFDGALRPWVPFSAHPHHDARTGETFNFGIDFARARPALRTYRMDSAGRVTSFARAPLPFASFVHDFALSERFMIFHVPPLVASVARFLFGLDSFFDTLRWRPDRGARWILVPRTGGAAIEIEAPPLLVGHFIGAFEQDDEIVVDFGRLGDWDGIGRSAAAYATSDWPDFGGMKVERHRIDVRTRRASSELLCDLPADFPRIHPDHETRRGGHCFMGCNGQAGEGGLFHAVMKLHRETGAVDLFDFGPDRTSLEPVFVPRPGSDGDDDGWLICLVYDAPSRRSHYAVLDARQVSDGPLATLSLPVSAGATFHGSWLQA